MQFEAFVAAGPGLQFDVDFFLRFVFQPSPGLIGGLAITIYASVIAQAAGVVLGTLSALAGMARNRFLIYTSADIRALYAFKRLAWRPYGAVMTRVNVFFTRALRPGGPPR